MADSQAATLIRDRLSELSAAVIAPSYSPKATATPAAAISTSDLRDLALLTPRSSLGNNVRHKVTEPFADALVRHFDGCGGCRPTIFQSVRDEAQRLKSPLIAFSTDATSRGIDCAS